MARNRKHLEVWLRGTHVATVSEPSAYRYRLAFTDEALETFGEDTRVLSLSLPLTAEPTTDHPADPSRRPVSAFLEGLLPEGNLRSQLASTLGVLALDKLALLAQVGAECAGAVQFLPPGRAPSEGRARRLSAEEVDRIVADLPTYHLPEGTALQASLAGIQDKVLLVELPDGAWGWPEDGAASTHLIKPEPVSTQTIPHLIQTEHWAMRVAAAAGLAAAETRLQAFGGREALVVTRYDRAPAGHRIHQEDFCQALGLEPSAKFEAADASRDAKSRLSRIASLAAPRSLDPDGFRRDLLSLVTFNVIIGNGDAHTKNYSVLLGDRGEVSLAPLYDAAPVMYLDSRFKNTGHVINNRTHIDWVDLDDLAMEAASWGMSAMRARATVDDTVDRVWDAVHAVELPQGTAVVLDRLEELWRRRAWRG